MGNDLPLKLSVILPAYNEGPPVVSAVQRYSRALEQMDCDHEILVIDDASGDDTWKYAQEAADKFPHTKAYRNGQNAGQSNTILRGFRLAEGNVLHHNAIDLPFDPADIGRLLDEIRAGADVVVAERSDRAAYGIVRKIISWANIALVQAMFRSPVIDHNFVQLYRREIFEQIEIETSGVSTVTTELIIKAHLSGAVVKRVHAPYIQRAEGESTIDTRRIIHTVKELFRLRGCIQRFRKSCPKQPSELQTR